MALTKQTGLALWYIGVRDAMPNLDPVRDWSVHIEPDDTVTLVWNRIEPEPTEQQIADAILEPGFATFAAERGGDAIETEKRKAKEQLTSDPLFAAVINVLRIWINEAIGGVATTKTKAALLQDVLDDLETWTG